MFRLKRYRTGVFLQFRGRFREKRQVVLSFLLLFVLLVSCVQDHDESDNSAMKVNVGDYVPAFILSGSDGNEVSSASLEGQIYILNFFDTGCPDCREELQVMQKVFDKFHGNVPILNVPRSQTDEEVKAYWNKAGLNMPFYMPNDKNLYYRFATKIIPRTYIVDGNGRVRAAFSDKPIADSATLETLLQQLIGEGSSGEGYVNLSMRLRIPARGRSIDDYYFHNEYTISNLEVWFFNAETKKFFTKAEIKGLSMENAYYDTRYDISYLFKDMRLLVGIYDIFFLANYYNDPIEAEDEMEFLNHVDSITYSDGVEANLPETGPVMTNRATSLMGINLLPWSNKSYMLSVELERVMAKLQIGVAQNIFQLKHNQRKYADINITNYKLVNLNRRYYLFQHRDSLPTFTPQPEFILPYHFSDYSDVGEQYVVDPLFYRKLANKEDAKAVGSYYQSWFGDFTTENFASMPSADNFGYAYILENTVFKTSQKNGYSPGVVFKAAVNPVFVYLYDFSQKALKEEYRPEYWPRVIYLYNYNFYGSVQAVNLASGLTLDELVTYTDEQLKTYGIKQCRFNMGVYETFYTYWIHHRCNQTDFMGAMEYGIVRNNFYRMVVTGVNGIGNSVIEPDIMRNNYPNSYVDVEVNVNQN